MHLLNHPLCTSLHLNHPLKYKLIGNTHVSNFDVRNISSIYGIKPGATWLDIHHTEI